VTTGMGDAAAGGDVPARDPDATIDAEPRGESAPVSEPRAPRAIGDDYGELVSVERQHYVVGEEIAKGGMGRVWAARDRRLGREVAIKELLPKHRDAARRFEREARITARLQHPAIIHIYEAGTWPGGEPFYAMPKVAGRSLDKVVAECATLNDRLGLLPHAIAVADALAYAHSKRVIHRDLKPSNVLVGEFGETVVIDWGLAKDLGAPIEPGESLQMRAALGSDTISGGIVGTPAYMPPEQARGESVDARADVYAIGALLYKVLVGHAPYSGSDAEAVLEEVKLRAPQSVARVEPGAPRDLAAIVAKAMAREPFDRYATAGELAADLKRFQTGQLVAAHRYTTMQLWWRWLRRRLVAVSIGGTALVAISIIATVSVRRIVAERARAEAGRFKLLEERGRSELLDGHPGKALAYLTAAARDGTTGGMRGLMLADAMRPFEAELQRFGNGRVVAVTSAGTRIATAGGKVEVWETAGAEGVRRVLDLGDRGAVRVLAWSADGNRLVAAGDRGTAWVWSADGKQLAELHHGTATVLDASFDASGERLATANADGTAVAWDIARGVQIAMSTCHDEPVVSARFSASGDRVVTASEDGTACVWSATTGGTIALLRGHTGPVEMASWARDDRWIVTASDDGTARVWSAELGKPVLAPMRHEPGSVVRLAVVSHDGRYVLTAGSDRVGRVWELPASVPDEGAVAVPRRVATLDGHGDAIISAAFSDDDSEIATGGADRLATIWDRERGQALKSFEHASVVASVAFAGHERLVTGAGEGQAAIWDARADKIRHDLLSPVHAIAVAPDGTIAAGTENSRVTLVRGEATTVLRGHMGRVYAVAFTPDGKRLISAGEDPRPIVWDAVTGTKLGELGEHAAPIRALAISGDGSLVATAAGDEVKLWTLDGKLVHTFTDRAATITTVVFDGGYVTAGTDDGALVAWYIADGQSVVWKRMPTAITSIALSPRDGAMAVAAATNVVIYPRVVIDHMRQYGSPFPLDSPGEVRSAVFSADGSFVITAGSDGAKLWDAATGKLAATRDAHGRVLEALALHGDTLWLASSDGTIGAWDVHVEKRAADELASFVRDHDPWTLGDDDVIQRKP
jgi:WD40 repeat protein